MRILFILIAMLALPLAQAGVTVYTDQAQFQAANPLSGIDSFDDLATGLTDGPLNRSAGAFSYSAGIDYTQDFFPLLVSGTDLALSSNQAASSITFDHFAPAVRGVGGLFFGTNFSGAIVPGASLRLQLTDASGIHEYALSGATSFIGLISESSILSLTISAAQDNGDVWPTISQLTVSAVPEPAAYLMLALGLSLLGLRGLCFRFYNRKRYIVR